MIELNCVDHTDYGMIKTPVFQVVYKHPILGAWILGVFLFLGLLGVVLYRRTRHEKVSGLFKIFMTLDILLTAFGYYVFMINCITYSGFIQAP